MPSRKIIFLPGHGANLHTFTRETYDARISIDGQILNVNFPRNVTSLTYIFFRVTSLLNTAAKMLNIVRQILCVYFIRSVSRARSLTLTRWQSIYTISTLLKDNII